MLVNIQFEVIDPRPSSLDSSINLINEWKSQGKKVVGFEVTVREQANLMDLNIDPQHLGGDSSRSCILECFESPISRDKEDYVFCTNRADLDSVGAMALVGHVIWNWAYDPEDLRNLVRERVILVHDADIFSRGEWSPKPLFSQGYEQPELGAIARAVSDFKKPLEQRIEWMAAWLCGGNAPESYQDQYEKEKAEIEEALASGKTLVETRDGISMVTSELRSGTSIGYSNAPVVIIYNPKMPSKNGTYKKFTICQYSSDYVDLKSVQSELNALEAGWGGSTTIIGSPQEEDTSLTIEKVFSIVRRHLIK